MGHANMSNTWHCRYGDCPGNRTLVEGSTMEQSDANGWLPIESAPHGKPILIYVPNRPGLHSFVTVGYRASVWNGYSATHWQPLPKGPVVK